MKIAFSLESECELKVGDAKFTGNPGTLVYVPKGSQHTFTTATGDRMLFVFAPVSNEELFLEMRRPGQDPTAEDLATLNKRFNTRPARRSRHAMAPDAPAGGSAR
jgi:hypothetical protein